MSDLPANAFFFQPARSRWREYGRPALLLVVTAVCVYIHGAFQYDGELLRFESHREGMHLAVAALSIMLAHEMGHYLACRYYGVDATVPHFLPAPLIFLSFHSSPVMISLIGTFGAFIRIRGPIPNRKALFDIGVAGPLAGFVFCLPVLYLAAHDVRFVPLSQMAASGGGIELNFPIVLRWAFAHFAPTSLQVPEGMTPVLGAYALAAWFGCFLTALNLMPVGQLDGGHVTYALLRRRAWSISYVASWLCVALVYFSPSWIVWSILLRLLGRKHPPTGDDEAPIGRGRAIVGVVALLVFLACFTPNPIAWSWKEAWLGFRQMVGLAGLFL